MRMTNTLFINSESQMFFNGSEYENASYEIDRNNMLRFKGDLVQFNIRMKDITDEQKLSEIRPEYIKIEKSPFRSEAIRYVPELTKYKLIKTLRQRITTPNFTIIDCRVYLSDEDAK